MAASNTMSSLASRNKGRQKKTRCTGLAIAIRASSNLSISDAVPPDALRCSGRFQDSLIFKNQRHGQQQFKTIFKCGPDKLARCAFVTAYRCYKHRSVKNRPHVRMISQAISHFNGLARHIKALGKGVRFRLARYPPGTRKIGVHRCN